MELLQVLALLVIMDLGVIAKEAEPYSTHSHT